MSTVTVVPTLELNNLPPRVKLDVTDVGSPNLFAATVMRSDPDGVLRPVRTTDGNPLVLTTSGANRVGLVYDYEMPYGSAVTYSTLESPTVITAAVTVTETDIWLIHPGVPSLSMPIEASIGSLEEELWGVQEGMHWPMGREFPVRQTAGQRQAPASSITVSIDSLAELADIRALVNDAGILLLNIPATLNLGFDPCYIGVGTVSNRRLSDIGTDPNRLVTLPFQVVDRPSGGSQSQRTLVDLMDYSSLASLQAAYATLAAVLAGP